MIGASGSVVVFEYAREGGFVSSSRGRDVAKSAVSVLACEREEAAVLLVFDESVLSRLLVCASADLGRLLLLCQAEVGKLCPERCSLLDGSRDLIDDSDKFAIALVVLSRANAVNVISLVQL